MSRVKFARLDGAEWVKRGPRGFLEYRDLGIAEATEGRFGGTVARVVELYREGGGTPRHTHDTGFHFIYILRGATGQPFRDIVRGSLPFVAVQAVVIAIVFLVPAVALALPDRLFG